LWVLDSTGAVKAAGTKVRVLHVHYQGAVSGDDLILQEYDSAGTAKSAVVLKAPSTLAVDISYMPHGILLNGLAVGTIDAGTAYVMIEGYEIPGAA
jgi:hypothetical protein